jgi:ABC-type glycerol-3-phosphate transport system substrate-binding protein
MEMTMKTNTKMKLTMLAAAAMLLSGAAVADQKAAETWVDKEFQPSSLNRQQQLAEMKWFIDAADKLKKKGVKEISVVSETIDTHVYESKTLAKAFEEITGIKVRHDIIQEGDVVEKLQTSMQSGKSIYDGWVSDSDLIGTHYRYGAIEPLSDYMQGAGKQFTNPGLDLKDFIGTSFTTAPDGKLYQLPDQQFANLYWFRADWFARKDLQAKFKAKYGYELGVPQNWSAYEDIAEFFTNDVKELDGKKVFGHMDYGKKDPSLGWRFTDAWLSMAGAADKGIPNGLPVDEWGIRVRADQIHRLDEKVRAAAGQRHDVLGSGTGAGPGRRGPADFLVHGVYRRHDQAGTARHEQGRLAQMAHGAVAAWPVLERGHAERLPGRRFVVPVQVDAGRPQGCRLAVRAVRYVENRLAEKIDRGRDLHSRFRHPP